MLVVLGHSGFIGRAVFQSLTKSADKVAGLSSAQLNLLTPQSSAVISNLSAEEPVFIFCPAVIPSQGGDNFESFRKNTEMVFNFSRGLRAGVKKVVFLSSNAVYGDHHFSGTFSESTPVIPHSFYAAAKLSGEVLLERVCADLGIPLLILRLTMVYGPGDKPRYNPAGLLLTALHNKKIEVFGEGEDVRDHLYLDDAARVIGQLAPSQAVGIYNVASGQSYSFRQVAEIIKSFLPETEIVFKPRRQPVATHHFNISKLKTALPPNFSFTSLKEGIMLLLKTDGGDKSS